MTLLSSTLPEPSFIDRDGKQVIRDMIAAWQEAVGKPLYPAQVERLLINLIGYRELLLRQGIQEAAKLNLVAYSRFPMLDLLGELVATYRLPAAPATTRFKFELTEVPDTDVPLSAGTQGRFGGYLFQTIEDAVVPAGETVAYADAVAVQPGASANGIIADSEWSVMNPYLTGNVTITNETITAGGADVESDERFQARIILSPERYSMGGPVNAYRYHVLSVRQDILHVGITSPAPGRVNVYPLMVDGLPSEAVLDQVRQVLLAETVRPLTDWVEVHAPTRVPYTVTLAAKTLAGANASRVFAAIQESLNLFATELRQSTGHDLVGSQWVERIQSVVGVYSCRVIGFEDRVLDASMWPDCEGLVVLNDGVGDDAAPNPFGD